VLDNRGDWAWKHSPGRKLAVIHSNGLCEVWSYCSVAASSYFVRVNAGAKWVITSVVYKYKYTRISIKSGKKITPRPLPDVLSPGGKVVSSDDTFANVNQNISETPTLYGVQFSEMF
jgi:hypothetical protein